MTQAGHYSIDPYGLTGSSGRGHCAQCFWGGNICFLGGQEPAASTTDRRVRLGATDLGQGDQGLLVHGTKAARKLASRLGTSLVPGSECRVRQVSGGFRSRAWGRCMGSGQGEGHPWGPGRRSRRHRSRAPPPTRSPRAFQTATGRALEGCGSRCKGGGRSGFRKELGLALGMGSGLGPVVVLSLGQRAALGSGLPSWDLRLDPTSVYTTGW